MLEAVPCAVSYVAAVYVNRTPAVKPFRKSLFFCVSVKKDVLLVIKAGPLWWIDRNHDLPCHCFPVHTLTWHQSGTMRRRKLRVWRIFYLHFISSHVKFHYSRTSPVTHNWRIGSREEPLSGLLLANKSLLFPRNPSLRETTLELFVPHRVCWLHRHQAMQEGIRQRSDRTNKVTSCGLVAIAA